MSPERKWELSFMFLVHLDVHTLTLVASFTVLLETWNTHLPIYYNLGSHHYMAVEISWLTFVTCRDNFLPSRSYAKRAFQCNNRPVYVGLALVVSYFKTIVLPHPYDVLT